MVKRSVVSFVVGGSVFSTSKSAFDLCSSQQFGEKVGERVVFSLCEAFFLFEKGSLEFRDYRDKVLSRQVILKKFVRFDRRFVSNYLVFKDLRGKGYVVKSALKFGAQFRVYPKGSKVGKVHAQWLVFPVVGSDRLSWQVFASRNRVAHSTKKKILFAVIDDEQHVTYFQSDWLKP